MTKNKKSAASTAAVALAPTTKIEQLLTLMRRPEGADVEALAKATGWQHHSVRGAIAGQIKKKLGLAVTATRAEGKVTYRLDA